jgi:hypothetical protein
VVSDLIPVLWLCGPPGAGKSTVGWEIFAQLTQGGTGASYVDIDQLGMCYPEPGPDPGRHRMKAQNLGAVVANFRAAGARCVIVSGVVDPGYGVHADMIPEAALTICRLRAGRDELKQRFLSRGGQAGLLEEVLSEAGAMDASGFADVCVDTSGLPVAEATRLVRERVAGWPGITGPSRPGEAKPEEEGLAIAGDGDPGNHRVKARNLAALWQTYRAAGARCLIAAGPVENDAVAKVYADALPHAAVRLCRLHAGADELTRRIMLRGQGGSWPQPGDPLAGQPIASLLRAAGRAAADADALEHAVTGALCIDTGRLTVEAAADVIAARPDGPSWPNRQAGSRTAAAVSAARPGIAAQQVAVVGQDMGQGQPAGRRGSGALDDPPGRASRQHRADGHA